MNMAFQQAGPRPEAMADVPGVCELALTRGVVQYRSVHEVELAGGRIQDIGLALVLEGRYASSVEAVDLGSGDVKLLDLSSELVVLDWVYDPTLEHVSGLIRAAAAAEGIRPGRSEEHRALERFCFRLAIQILERVGYGPLTRPTLLRIGFRDICRDLDLHAGTSVRIVLGPSRVVRTHLDYDGNALVFRTPTADSDVQLETALFEAFPAGELRRLVPEDRAAAGGYQVRFAYPADLDELRGQISAVRSGLVRLLDHFEPGRVRDLEDVLRTFGRRETLAGLSLRTRGDRYDAVTGRAATVH